MALVRKGRKMPYVLFVTTIVIAFIFYWLRKNHRILYGLIEILVALFFIYVTYFSPPGPTFLVWGKIVPAPLIYTLVQRSVTFFVGVYAFVRGFDNLVTGLREPNI
jgi:hypothetical protein